MQQICSEHATICNRSATKLNKYANKMQIECSGYAEICINMHKYTRNMQEMCKKYARNMHKICKQYA